jgi:hypothetical protein
MQTRILFVVVACLFFITSSVFTQALAEETPLRAKIGIQIKSGDRITRAKSKERLKSGDLFRIYVHSEENCTIYIIHSDEKTVSLLNITEQKVQSTTLILPSAQAYYQVDGTSSVEKITIICSPGPLPELASIETNGLSYDKWVAIQGDLTGKSQIMSSQKNEKPFSIAGNVRGIADPTTGDAFVGRLQIYSGRGILVKNYDFKVKK